jgi:tripeptide aminopeptidase
MEIHIDRNRILNRFLSYVLIDTQSDETSATCPSTKKQFLLAELLKSELEEIGLNEVILDKNGYVTAKLPANCTISVPVIGFIAHMDTSPDLSGESVKPMIIENYDGNDIILNMEKNIVLSPRDFSELPEYKGNTIICTDGTTLLGADDKAGIAEIITAMEYLIQHPDIKHGDIKVGFTPDEEIGRGVDFFNVSKFGANFAYTMDGGAIGELEYENFNACQARITINGRNIHPGYAKGKMLNSLLIAMELNDLLPVNQRPEFTENYEGFFHLVKIEGNVEKAYVQYIIRDHDTEKFAEKKEIITRAVEFVNRKYKEDVVVLELNHQYFNMKEKILPVFHIIEIAKKAMELSEVVPRVVPIRGGTDGARLSFMGLPCPNIFAGGHNFHGKFEYVPLESMMNASEVIIRIACLITKS